MIRTTLAATALLLGVSTLAGAQTSTTTPSARPTMPAPSGGTSTPGAGGSTSSSGSSSITGDQIKDALEERGYSNVQVQPGANGHNVTAMKDGKQVRLSVDPSGRVTQTQ